MSIENSSFLGEINQLAEENQIVLDHIEQVKAQADAAVMPHLEEIEKHALRVSIEIEEINRKQTMGAEIIHISGA